MFRKSCCVLNYGAACPNLFRKKCGERSSTLSMADRGNLSSGGIVPETSLGTPRLKSAKGSPSLLVRKRKSFSREGTGNLFSLGVATNLKGIEQKGVVGVGHGKKGNP